MKKILALLALTLSMASATVHAQVRNLDIGDIESFGDEFVGKTVRIVGKISNTYSCTLASNRGYRCLKISNPKQRGKVEEALIRDGAYRFEQYKDWMNDETLLAFTGTVELRETVHLFRADRSMTPALIVRRIEAAN